MKISIITTTYNSAQTLEQTILSVLSQKNVELEYIIVDGGSTDGTLAIIEKYKDNVSKIISEKDQGIYDAMNKGVALATGEVVGILNSDDYYQNDNVLASVVEKMTRDNLEACYGDLLIVNKDNTAKVERIWRAEEYRENKLNNGWIPPHPTFFCRREVYERFGMFRLDLRLAADYEFMLRVIKIGKISMGYIPRVLTCMRAGGSSSGNFKSRREGWTQLKKSWQVNELTVPLFLILRRVFFKLPQFLRFVNPKFVDKKIPGS